MEFGYNDATRQYQHVIALQRAYQPSIYHTAAATTGLRSVIVETARLAMSVEILSSTVFLGKNRVVGGEISQVPPCLQLTNVKPLTLDEAY